MKNFFFLILLRGVVASGCAIGNKHNYHLSNLNASLKTMDPLTVGVQDHRPYITNHDKEPNFVGLQRGGYGNTFDVTTQSGMALSQDFLKVIVTAFQLNNIQVDPITIPTQMTRDQALALLLPKTQNKALLVTIEDWKSDTYNNTALHYKVILDVLNKSGDLLGRSQVVGTDDLGGSFWNPPSHARQAVPQAYKRKLEALLNDPSILAAFK